ENICIMSSSKNDIREGHYSISYKSPNNEFKHNSNKLETNQDGQIPKDNYLMVYFTFFLLGIATVLAWNGLAGVIVSVFEIVSAITIENKKTPTDAELSQMAFACFLFSMFIALLSIITYFILTWSPLYRHYFPPQETLIIHPIDQTLSNHSLQSTFNRIQLLCFAIFYDFTITLGLYPSITAFIKSTTPIQNRYLFQQDYLFIPIHFLIFNIFDWIGRSLPGFKSLQRRRWNVRKKNSSIINN
ncbi:37144_t:CDS:2, partial [Gigaspora margarita]